MNRSLILPFCALVALACAEEKPRPAPDPEGPPVCPPGTLDCLCQVHGDDDPGCEDDAVCDATTHRCRTALACEELACVQHQRCAPSGDGLDAACLTECEPGFLWEADRGRCSATEASCDSDHPRSVVDECRRAGRDCVSLGERSATCGGCREGLVLRSGDCRELVRCESLFCADQNRTCLEADGATDARCEGCEDGTIEDLEGRCVRQSCTFDADGASLAAVCDAEQRACQSVDSGARCGKCYAGYVDEEGTCEPILDCEARKCNAGDRLCVTGDDGRARCAGCRAGYREVAGVCVVDPDATCAPAPARGSVLAACEAEHRQCVNDRCGGCVAGYYWDSERGACTESVSCERCDAAHRDCVSENGANRCGACAADHVLDKASGDCRATLRCADVDCAPGDVCVEATADADALCRTDCGAYAIFNGGVCVPCPACTAKDRAGNPIELGFEPRATRNGECICRTAPNHFYSLAGEVGTFPCDADGDGWVRQSARVAYDLGDPILRENARCALRYIDRFVLKNEHGDALEVPLEAPLPMAESDRNDDDGMLRVTWDRLGLPMDFDPSYVDPAGAACTQDRDCGEARAVCRSGHCTAVQTLSARALNALTKYCHSVLTDYNDNGVADVEEWGARPTNRGAERRVLNEFSYFAELHTGRFEPHSEGSPTGAFVIRERARAAGSSGAHSALTYSNAAADAHWRTCTVRRDVEWDKFSRPIGMDFASHEANPAAYLVDDATPMWRGMTHHSQFKCLVVTSEPDEESPHEISVADAAAPSRELNTCRLVDIEDAAGATPAPPVFSCAIRPTIPTAGDVLWASVNYNDYPSAASLDGYVRGCVNGCAEARLRADGRLSKLSSWDCPTAEYSPQRGENLACTRDLADHGKLVCLEACGDGLDNDGDGLTDAEDLYFTDPVTNLELSMGQACNTSLPGVCATGVVGCEPKPGGALTCIPDTAPSALDLCDGLDNDCDNRIDEDALDPPPGSTPMPPSGTPRVGEACDDRTQLGICQAGMLLCRDLVGGGRGLTCQTIRPTGEAETCNGLDDDCDGETDEVADLPPPFGTSCAPTDGSGKPLVGVCAEGEQRCVGGQPQCAQLQQATDEVWRSDYALCDNLDNDCDSQVDEDGVCDGSFTYSVSLVPTTPTQGDREFDGNGPRVTITTSHQLVNGGAEVEVCAEFVETQPDHSTGRACGTRTVTVPGRTIVMVSSPAANVVYVDTDKDRDQVVGGNVTETLVQAQLGDLFDVNCMGDLQGDDIGEGTHCNVAGRLRFRVQPAPRP